MSLRVWLPLTRDLRNQGLDDVVITNNGATFSSAGKLGGSYTGRIDVSSSIIPTILNGSEFTVAFWIYINEVPTGSSAADTYVMVCGTSGTRAQFHIAIRQNGAGFAFCFYADDYTFYNTVTDKVGKWMHVVCAFKNNTQIVYVDGTKVGERATTGGLNVAANSILHIYAAHERLNDVRIYDHCLSPMEVKQLSQGLVLHYPLNRGGWGQENLLSRYVVPGQAAPTSTAAGGRTTWLGDYKITIPATENADTYFRLFTTKQLTTNATYTISCNVDGLLSGSYYRFPLYAQGNTAMGVLNLDHNGLCSLTFTMTYGTQTAATGANGETVYICFMDDSSRAIASGQGAITISNFKLEEGSIATPWCPNSSDALATTMDLNGTTEYDCSGYCNNGTKIGTFTYSSDTPKYSVATEFNGTNATIDCGKAFDVQGAQELTWSCWAYSDSWNDGVYKYFISSQESGGIVLAALSSSNNIRARVHAYTAADLSTSGYIQADCAYASTGIATEGWHMLTGVYTTSNIKIYIDGELKKTTTTTTYGIHFNQNAHMFLGAECAGTAYSNLFACKISDVRIYATALSAADVKSLYQNSAYIDSSGNVYGAVHSEV